MKPKHLLIGVSVLLAAGGLWAGRATWRARHQLVSLDVRELPLRDVLRKLERQTRTTIRAEKSLDARITLHVAERPLAYVLDRVAEQAGAHWSKLYAVYDSARALEKLDSTLADDGKLEAAGWTKLVPNPEEAAFPDPVESGPVSPPEADSAAPPPARMRGGMMMMRRGPNGPVVFSAGPGGQMEVWSPEELVIESALSARLGSPLTQGATPETAAQAAQKVNGRWTTYLALSKSSMGMGMGVGGFGGPPPPGQGPAAHNPNERFAHLTPEQRVERARNRERFHFEPK